jgi:hypothetical protein
VWVSGERIKAGSLGEGRDASDKAINKAMTASMKYLLKRMFALSTNEVDADAENIVDQVETQIQGEWATDDQMKLLTEAGGMLDDAQKELMREYRQSLGVDRIIDGQGRVAISSDQASQLISKVWEVINADADPIRGGEGETAEGTTPTDPEHETLL